MGERPRSSVEVRADAGCTGRRSRKGRRARATRDESVEKIGNRWQAALLQEQAKVEEAAAGWRARLRRRRRRRRRQEKNARRGDGEALGGGQTSPSREPGRPVSLGARPAVGKVNLSRSSTTTTTVVSRPTAAKPWA